MLATTLGIEFDPEKAWSEREQVFKTREDDPQDAQRRAERRGHTKGHWSTVVALGVFIF